MTYTRAAATTDAYLLFPKDLKANGSPARASGDDENGDFAAESRVAGRPTVGGVRRTRAAPEEMARNDRHWDRNIVALMIANSWLLPAVFGVAYWLVLSP